MSTSIFNLPPTFSEPAKDYAPGSVERAALFAAIEEIRQHGPYEVPIVINGEEVKSGDLGQQVYPSDHKTVLANYHKASPDIVKQAIEGALAAKDEWEAVPWSEKVAIWHKMAYLVTDKYRYKLMAATMLGQAKNIWQAEIDLGAELPDFLRFGPSIVQRLYESQPDVNDRGHWNRIEWRSLEGFICVVSPFNFTALAGNLVCTPLLVGNVTVWKPSDYSILASYFVHQIFLEAGVPAGAVQFVPGEPDSTVQTMIANPKLAGLHFTGSSEVFQKLNMDIARNLPVYRSFPRIVGETGGKNFTLVHKTANTNSVVNHTIRAAFEYQGQKCSALSRLYVSRSLWDTEFRDRLLSEMAKLTVGNELDVTHFVNSVIHKGAFDRIKGYIEQAKKDGAEVISGGKCDDSVGYFVEPTIILTNDPQSITMRKEVFGPVLTIYLFDDDKLDETLELVDTTADYALTGSIFATDRAAIRKATAKLRYTAGNFYIQDKCTAAAVGAQPFGGARMSGTNDKVASAGCFSRFLSPRAVKETFTDLDQWSYPSNLA